MSSAAARIRAVLEEMDHWGQAPQLMTDAATLAHLRTTLLPLWSARLRRAVDSVDRPRAGAKVSDGR